VDASQAQALISEFDAFATAEGFIAVYPQSLSFGGTQFWQSDADSEDVAFVDALLSEVSAAFCVDRERIYSTGFSSGALMSYTLACVRSEVFAAVAPVAGLVGVDGCEPASPVGLIAFNGTADARIDHSAGAESAEAFAARAGCDPDPVETFREGDASCVTYAGCRPGQEVEFCTIDEGGHTWPGSEGSERILSNFGEGKTSTDLNANAKMWAFFEALSL
jgi:polyhydroxybutyrate depolymerase